MDACEWCKKVADSLPKRVDHDFPELKTPESPPRIFDKELTEEIERLRALFREYEKSRIDRQELLVKGERTEWETTLFAFGPLLLSIALAIRITKVSGEISLEKGP